ncbi:hypothetical protein ACUJ63_004823 [Salmonella enterica subsp. enterica]
MENRKVSDGVNLINKDGYNILSVELSKYHEGIVLATQLCCEGFYLKADPFIKTPSVHVDLSLLGEIKGLKDLSIGPNIDLSPKQDMSPIYALSTLTALTIHAKNTAIDFNYLNNLTSLTISYSKKISNFNKLSNLKNLWLWHLNTNDLGFLDGLCRMQKLKITQSQITSLNGLSKCECLRILHLTRCPKLFDLTEINKLRKLNGVFIVNSKGISDFSFLKNNSTIEQIGLDKVESLGFICSMPNLKTIGFNDLVDGNIAVALKNNNIERITFYPDRKHYTHTQSEVEKIIAHRELSA